MGNSRRRYALIRDVGGESPGRAGRGRKEKEGLRKGAEQKAAPKYLEKMTFDSLREISA